MLLNVGRFRLVQLASWHSPGLLDDIMPFCNQIKLISVGSFLFMLYKCSIVIITRGL